MEWRGQRLVYLPAMPLAGDLDPVPEVPFLLAGASSVGDPSWGCSPSSLRRARMILSALALPTDQGTAARGKEGGRKEEVVPSSDESF